MVMAIMPWVSKNKSFFLRLITIKLMKIRGMDIIVVTSANTDDEARELLAELSSFRSLKLKRGRGSDMAKKSAVEKNNKRKRIVAC